MNACEVVCNFINIFANVTFDPVTFDLICVILLSHLLDICGISKSFWLSDMQITAKIGISFFTFTTWPLTYDVISQGARHLSDRYLPTKFEVYRTYGLGGVRDTPFCNIFANLTFEPVTFDL